MLKDYFLSGGNGGGFVVKGIKEIWNCYKRYENKKSEELSE